MVASKTHGTIKACLACISPSIEDLSACESLEDEWRIIKKAFHRRALESHPDKGGDPAAFREFRAAFEVLKDLFERHKVTSFAQSMGVSTAAEFECVWTDLRGSEPPSWEYYSSAAKETVPGYRMESAKSDRSKCNAKGKAKNCEAPQIPKDSLRVGWMDPESGSYGRWVHLGCWRVPSSIWLGLPNPDECNDKEQFHTALQTMNEVNFCGYGNLSDAQRDEVLRFVMEKGNWARLVKRKGKAKEEDGDPSSVGGGGDMAAIDSGASGHIPGDAIVKAARPAFSIPIPGKDGAIPGALARMTCVLTGVFPEVGGGAGLSMGKDKVKTMIESFGGRCTSSISGKTDILVVGKEPGFSKVSKARGMPSIRILGLDSLRGMCMGTALEDAKPAPAITNFSAGYRGNGLALIASETELAAARGEFASKQIEDTKHKPSKVKKPTKPAKGKRSVVDQPSSSTLSTKGESKKKAKTQNGAKKMEEVERSSSPPALGFNISCDVCGVDCTEESWHAVESEEDYCAKCRVGKTGCVAQKNGVDM